MGCSSVDSTTCKANVLERAVGNCPEIEVRIEGVSCKCLLDTGSQVSTVTESFFKDLLKSKPPLHDVTKWLRVTGANHLDIPYIGYIEVAVDVLGEVVHDVGILVVKDPIDEQSKRKKSVTPGILGSNMFSLLKAKLDPSISGSDEKRDERKLILALYEMSISEPEATEKQVSFVTVPGKLPVKIPANSVTVVNGLVNNSRLKDTTCVAIQALKIDQGAIPRNLMVIDTNTVVKNSKVPIRVANLGQEDVWLQPKMRLGIAQVVDVVRDCTSESQVEFEVSENVITVSINKMEVKVKDTSTEVDECNLADLPFKVNLGDVKLTSEEQSQMTKLFYKYKDCFCVNDDDLGYTETIKHKIETVTDQPIKVPHRRIPPYQMEEVRQHISKLLKQNVIRRSTSPYAAPVVLVRKKDGSLRLCVDYRQLNSNTIKDAYPLPRIDEAFEAISKSTCFSSVDLAQGYYQVAIDEADIHKTAFRVGTEGLYEY